jgi:regulator of sigma E protease
MSIIIFLVILAILIFVHELGHFIAAKRSGIRVDEFAVGFPPKVYSIKKGETTYSLNAIPFGGYVKIFGEDPDDESISGPDKDRSFVHKPKLIKAVVLSAGIFFNILFAWFLLSLGFMIGLPFQADNHLNREVLNPVLMITSVVQDSPAHEGGLRPGDSIAELRFEENSLSEVSASAVIEFITSHLNEEITLVFERGGETMSTVVTPRENIWENQESAAIGVSMDTIGTLRLPLHLAFYEGGRLTIAMTGTIAVALFDFFSQVFTGSADFSQVAGPVGIVGLVGEASEIGFIYLLSFTAFISINLALINLIPFPALDGGRLLFLLIEFIKRSPINPKFANALNMIGFAFLILLMLVVTFHDVLKLF